MVLLFYPRGDSFGLGCCINCVFSVCHLRHSSDLPEMGIDITGSDESDEKSEDQVVRVASSALVHRLGGELGVLLGGKSCVMKYIGGKKGVKLKLRSHLLCSMMFFHPLEDLSPVFDVTFSG